MVTKDQASEFDTITSLADGDKLIALDVSATSLNDESGPGGTVVGITYANLKAAIAGVGIFRPESYGAAADGTTDDTTAIQAAVTAASAAGGGIVQFDAATYLTDQINAASKVHFRGMGRGATVLKLKNGADDETIYGTAKSQFTISDLSINGNKANQTAGFSHGIMLEGCSQVLIHNVEAYDCAKDGIYVNTSSDVLVEFCYSHDNYRNGYSCGQGSPVSTNVTFRSCVSENHATASTDIGFAIEPGVGCRIIDCTSDGDSYSITIADDAANNAVEDTIVSGCRITDSGVVGIYAGGGAGGGTGIQITNNTIIGGSTTSILIDAHTPNSSGKELLITGNKLTSANSATVATHGIKVASSSTGYWTITGNTIHDLGGHGLWVAAGEGGTVTGNAIYNCSMQSSGTYDAIRLGATSNDITISGNRIFDDQGTETTGYGVRGDSGADRIHLSGNSFGSFATGEVTGLGAGSSGVWLTYTPTWLNFSVGNGAVTARYFRSGKKVDVMIHVQYGSTSSFSGAPLCTLPSTASDINQGAWSACAYDNGTQLMELSTQPRLFSTTQTPFITAPKADSTYVYTVGLSNTIPFAWANGDYFTFCGFYQEA